MKSSQTKVDRRKFLAGVAVAGATAASLKSAEAAPTTADGGRLPAALPPSAHEIAIETGAVHDAGGRTGGRPSSDFMVDVIKSFKIDYVYSNPASSFRGLHESLINYGKNTLPEFITCMHEESSVAMCHGNFKATGKPIKSFRLETKNGRLQRAEQSRIDFEPHADFISPRFIESRGQSGADYLVTDAYWVRRSGFSRSFPPTFRPTQVIRSSE